MTLAESITLTHAQTLGRVLACGQTEGLWTALPLDAEATHGCVRYVTHEHQLFELHIHDAGRKITATVAARDVNRSGITTWVSEVLKSGEAAPEATASAEKDPAKLARELARRIVNNAQALDVARRVNARHASKQVQRETLLNMVAKLSAIGYRVPGGITPSEHTEVAMYGSGQKLHQLRVNAGGNVYTASLSVHFTLVNELEALLVRSAALNERV
jgi:hypothetical protein